MSESPEDIRRQQIQHGRTLHVTNRVGNDNGSYVRNGGSDARTTYKKPERKVHRPKGHDAILAELQETKAKVRFNMMSGEKWLGTIVGRDKFTITVDDGFNKECIYKHAIESFGVSVEALQKVPA